MASSFGEIVEPVSRTAWEDWDDIIPEHSASLSLLKWDEEIESPQEIETFMIFEGKYLTDCITSQACQNKIELVNGLPIVNLKLFRLKTSNKYICTLTDYDLLLSSDIVELLKPYLIISKEVIAIQTKSLNEYQTPELSAQDCVIRMVCTTQPPSKSLDIGFSKLEQPNIISGVSAGVVCMREHLDQFGAAIVCFMEHPEEHQTEEMQKLLEKLNISQKSNLRPSSVLNSNLYI